MHNNLDIAYGQENMGEARLKWLGHLQKRLVNVPLRKGDRIILMEQRDQNQSQRTCMEEENKRDLLGALSLVEEMIENDSYSRC